MNYHKQMKLGKKVLFYLLTIWLVASFNFFLIRFMPGDPLEHLVGTEDYLYLTTAHPEVLEELGAKYGLDKSALHQYGTYLFRLCRGDLGRSYKNNLPVLDIILKKLGRTFRLIVPAVLLAAVLGILLGAAAGWNQGHRSDRWISRLALIIYAIPGYCLGMIGLMIFCFWLGIAPTGGMSSGGLSGGAYIKDLLWHMALPVGVLTLSKLSYNVLMMRSSIIETMKEDHILMAKTRGFSDCRILFRHVLPNAALPMIPIITMQTGSIISGSMMLEQLFNWDGMGLLVYKAIGGNDYPILQGSLLVLTICVVLANLLSDFLCELSDPRIKDGVWNER